MATKRERQLKVMKNQWPGLGELIAQSTKQRRQFNKEIERVQRNMSYRGAIRIAPFALHNRKSRETILKKQMVRSATASNLQNFQQNMFG